MKIFILVVAVLSLCLICVLIRTPSRKPLSLKEPNDLFIDNPNLMFCLKEEKDRDEQSKT